MLRMLGLGEIVLIASAVVIFFSAKKLPEAVKSVKKSMKAFQGGLKGEEEARPVKDVTPKAGAKAEKAKTEE
jgi:Sec-independent protein translocase protein TatA